MSHITNEPITELLGRWAAGETGIENQLIELVYPVLLEKARMSRSRHRGYLTLDTREIANEAYMNLIEIDSIEYRNRNHFFAIAAKVTSQLVIDYLRKRSSQKRGGRLPLLSLDEVQHQIETPLDGSVDWLGLDEALNALKDVDPICVDIVEMKFFSGLTGDEIAEVCSCSEVTIRRKWRFAKAWLLARLEDR